MHVCILYIYVLFSRLSIITGDVIPCASQLSVLRPMLFLLHVTDVSGGHKNLLSCKNDVRVRTVDHPQQPKFVFRTVR